MIDVSKTLVTELSKCGLPVYYELFVNSNTTVPCITYIEQNNSDLANGDTISYSNIAFQVKVWSKQVSDFYTYGALIDAAMKDMGYTRTFANPLFINNLGQFILRYEAIGYEK